MRNHPFQHEMNWLKVLPDKELRVFGKAPRQSDLAWVCQIEGLEVDIYVSGLPGTGKLLT